MIKQLLADGSGTSRLAHVGEKGGVQGVVSLTESLYDSQVRLQPLTSADFGSDMNKDHSTGGTPELIHNGTDTAGWTGSNVVGTSVTFNSASRPFAGTNSVYVNGPSVGDIWQFAKGSTFDPANYEGFSAKINIDWRYQVGEVITMYAWDTTTATQVGSAVDIANYFDETLNDTWQDMIIPFTDMGITGQKFDAVRFQFVTAVTTPPEFFIDNFQVEEESSSIYSYAPTPNETVYLCCLRILMADNVTAESSFDAFLGVSAISPGITANIISSGETVFSQTFSQLSDVLKFPSSVYQTSVGATATWLTVDIGFNGRQIKLSGDTGVDRVSFGIQADLSALSLFRTYILINKNI